jgi:hypothetical protein
VLIITSLEYPAPGPGPNAAVFERWVTPEDAELDLLRAAAVN